MIRVEIQVAGKLGEFMNLPIVPRKGDYIQIEGREYQVLLVVLTADSESVMVSCKKTR